MDYKELIDGFYYMGLFAFILLTHISTFIAPLLPEAAILYAATRLDPFLVILVASVAATLGGVPNYWVGRGVDRWWLTRKRRIRGVNVEKLRGHFSKWGGWAITGFVVSPIPFTSDAITMTAGSMRFPITKVVAYRLLGELIRVSILVGLAHAGISLLK